MVPDEYPDFERFAGRLAIPYITPAGVTTIRFRCIGDHNCKDEGHAKYLGMDGHDPRLYNVEDLFRDEPILAICEGEFDTMTVHLTGVPSVGFQGVDNWQPSMSRAIGCYERIVVLADNDDDGVGFDIARHIAREVEGSVLPMPRGYDVNATAVKWGLDTLRRKLLG